MKTVEKEAKSLEEAKVLAMEELEITDESLMQTEVLEEKSKGILGMGGKFVRIKAWLKGGAQNIEEVALDIMTNILNFSNLKAEIEWKSDEDQNRISVNGQDLGAFIGKYGQTLDALQYIFNIIVSKKINEKSRIIVDVGDYRARRERHLQDLAYCMAEKAKEERRNIILDPMIPSERRIIHIALKDHPLVETYSSGDEPMRKVIISPKKRA